MLPELCGKQYSIAEFEDVAQAFEACNHDEYVEAFLKR